MSNSDDVLVTVNEGVKDTVTITKAEYRSKNKQLNVEAISDDSSAVLTVVGYGQMQKKRNGVYALKKDNVASPGATITVTSSSGGSDTENVRYI